MTIAPARLAPLPSPRTDVPAQSLGDLIRTMRRDRGWSQPRLIHALRLGARARGWELPQDDSMKASLSRWENNWRRPDAFYRRLLCEAFIIDAASLDDVGASPNPRVLAA